MVTATLQFDAATIECKKGVAGNEDVQTGGKVKETEEYRFFAKNLAQDETVEEWKAGGTKVSFSASRYPLRYAINKDHIENDIIEITCVKRKK